MSFDEYFDRRSTRFASFYRSRAVSRAFGRGALFERMDFAIDKSTELGAQRVLDIGCGSGPLFRPLTNRGIRVTGIEPAPGMLELARREAAQCNGLAEVVQTGWEQIPAWHTAAPFDVAIALGVFDYVPNADDMLQVMAGAARHVIASFPLPGVRTNLRKLRYGARGVSVYGYSRERITGLAAGAGIDVEALVPLARAGYALLGRRRDDAAPHG
jgi:SAM-dependent methyltransferase